ncbi:MAG: outer membrane protein assembly factor BamA [Nitrospirae bacterium]|nr:outer membrane protein assembly factor BamA [Candidatus Troglogloeales bacterium]
MRVLIILLAALAVAATSGPLLASSWEGKIIAKIDYEQNGVSLEESLIQAIDMKHGELYETERIRQAMERLYATGKVKIIKVEVTELSEDQIAVRWILAQRQIVSSIVVSGQHRFSQEEIFDALHFKPNETLDEDQWAKRVLSLTTFYHNEGYFNVQIKSQFKASAGAGSLPHDASADGVPSGTRLTLEIDEGDRARINTLTFTGNPVFPDLLLRLSVLSQNPEYFSQKLLTEDINRLKAFYKKKGYLKASVGPPSIHFLPNLHKVNITLPIYASTKIDLFFHGVEPFSLLGARPLRGGESLDRFVDINEERGDDDAVLEDAARAIERYYHDTGYPFAKVRVQAKRFSDPDRMEAHFTIENITRARIREIKFIGNSVFSAKRLRKLVLLQKEGIWTKTRFTQEQLQEDAKNLALFYKKEGFQEARVTPDIHFDAKKKWATLTFRIEEGLYTFVETISLKGAEKLSQEAIFSALSLHIGDPYNKGVIREGARQILTLYSRLGYLSAKVDSTVTFSPGLRRAQLEYQIAEGEQTYFGSLMITGNLETKGHVLLREMVLQKGDPFDNEKILLSQQRLSQTGLFSSIHFEPEHNADDPAVQDLHLTVVERPRWALELGVGYLDQEGGRGFLGVNQRNLFGTGRKISARVEGGAIERRYSLNYKEPRVFSYNADATIGATYFKTQAGSFNEFNEEAFVGTVGVEKRLSSLWKSVFLYEYKDTEITNVTPGVTLTDQDVGQLIIASVNPSLIRDTRDDPFNPTSGSIHVTTLRNGAKILGSDVQLVKITHQSSLFFSPTSITTVALSVRGGGARKFGETTIIPLSERFFSGGRSTVRGYAQNKLGILGETIHNGVPTGGNALLIFNEELRISIFKSLGMVLFLDHGNVWSEFDEIKLGEIKSTTGIGFRYNTPVGPFRIDWGYKLNREGSESPSEFQFMLGHAF